MPDDPLRIIGYGRQSLSRPGEDQASSLSLRGQADLFHAECARRGWTAAGFVTDHDLKGDDPNRPGIHELLERVRAGTVDGVWVTMLNRFSNDYLWQGMTWRQLKQLGVAHLISYVEGPVEDEFILGIHGLVSGKRITELKVHLKNAFARRAKDGEFPTGQTPLGYVRPHTITATRANGTTYQRATGTPAIDPDAAALIRAIYARFVAGESTQTIARWLDAERVPTPRGGIWREGYVKKILTNPIYAGDVAHNGAVVAHDDRWQIVERATWDAAQTRFRTNVVVHGVPEHWLEGMVVHACGRRMYYQARGVAHPGGDYCCLTSKLVPSAACGIARPRLSATMLETAVRSALALDFATVPDARAVEARALALAGGRDAHRARHALDQRLVRAEQRWARNHNRYNLGKLTEDEMDREDEVRATEREAVAAALGALPVAPDPDAIRATCAQLQALADALPGISNDRLRSLLSGMITAIVSVDGVRMAYRFDPFGLYISPVTVQTKRGRISAF